VARGEHAAASMKNRNTESRNTENDQHRFGSEANRCWSRPGWSRHIHDMRSRTVFRTRCFAQRNRRYYVLAGVLCHARCRYLFKQKRNKLPLVPVPVPLPTGFKSNNTTRRRCREGFTYNSSIPSLPLLNMSDFTPFPIASTLEKCRTVPRIRISAWTR